MALLLLLDGLPVAVLLLDGIMAALRVGLLVVDGEQVGGTHFAGPIVAPGKYWCFGPHTLSGSGQVIVPLKPVPKLTTSFSCVQVAFAKIVSPL